MDNLKNSADFALKKDSMFSSLIFPKSPRKSPRTSATPSQSTQSLTQESITQSATSFSSPSPAPSPSPSPSQPIPSGKNFIDLPETILLKILKHFSYIPEDPQDLLEELLQKRLWKDLLEISLSCRKLFRISYDYEIRRFITLPEHSNPEEIFSIAPECVIGVRICFTTHCFRNWKLKDFATVLKPFHNLESLVFIKDQKLTGQNKQRILDIIETCVSFCSSIKNLTIPHEYQEILKFYGPFKDPQILSIADSSFTSRRPSNVVQDFFDFHLPDQTIVPPHSSSSLSTTQRKVFYPIPKSGLPNPGHLKNLLHLRLTSDLLSNSENLSQLYPFPSNITSLAIDKEANYSAEQCRYFHNLQHISIQRTRDSLAMIELMLLSSWKSKLEFLKVPGLFGLFSRIEENVPGTKLLLFLSKFPNLKYLDLTGPIGLSMVSQDFMLKFADRCPNLEYLKLSQVTFEADGIFQMCLKLVNLKTLNLRRSRTKGHFEVPPRVYCNTATVLKLR